MTNIPKPFFEDSSKNIDKKINKDDLDKVIKEMIELSKENTQVEEEIEKDEIDLR